MPRKKDITGRRFGRLVAIEPTGETWKGQAVWRCKCDCGNEKETTVAMLAQGNVASCGCLHREHIRAYNVQRGGVEVQYGKQGDQSIIGQRFGKLVVTEFLGHDQKSYMVYRCKCDCGNFTTAKKGELTHGRKRSCGCLHRDNRKYERVGYKAGHLEVISEIGSYGGKAGLVLCRCDCGRMVVRQFNGLLHVGTRTRCGSAHKKPISPNFRDLAGQRYGSLLVLREAERASSGAVIWECLCLCGRKVMVRAGHLKSRHATSCGREECRRAACEKKD